MFKLRRHKPGSYGDRLEFKFFNLHLLQVPKGWDRLLVSVISTLTGKPIGKSGKAFVQNGACRWADSISGSISLSQEDNASKEPGCCRFKFVISMVGSARSGVLGETVLNVPDYVSLGWPEVASLPLDNCSYGSILQLQVQCLTRRAKSSDGKSWIERTLHRDGSNACVDYFDDTSGGESYNTFNRVIGSPSINHLGRISNPEDHGNMDGSDSGRSSAGRANFSPKSSANGGSLHINGRQDSTGSNIGAVFSPRTGDVISRSNHSSFNSRLSGSSNANQWQELSAPTSPLVSSMLPESAKDLLEAAEETVEELRDEANMWERHARKLKGALDVLKKECSENSKQKAELDMELSAALSERDSLKQELEQFKLSFGGSVREQMKDGRLEMGKISLVQKEMEDELKFLKESNANLCKQLDKTQESNIELLSVLEELEETIEKQRSELESLSRPTKDIEQQEGLASRTFSGIETRCVCKLSEEGRTISGEVNCYDDLTNEIEVLRAKVLALERDCAELTEENLELVLKMQESSREKGRPVIDDIQGEDENDFLALAKKMDIQVSSSKVFESKIMELESIKHELELRKSELENENLQLTERVFSLEDQLRDLTKENLSYVAEMDDSSLIVSGLKDEISRLQDELEAQKAESKQKLDGMYQMLVDSQEEAESLKSSAAKLQGTIENLIDECDSLRKITADLRTQRLKSHEQTTLIVDKLKELQKKSSDSCRKLEIWEENLNSLQKDVIIKENSLTTTLESIFQEHKVHGDKLSQLYFMLNRIKDEKAVELNELKSEIVRLNPTAKGVLGSQEQELKNDIIQMISDKNCKQKIEDFLDDAHHTLDNQGNDQDVENDLPKDTKRPEDAEIDLVSKVSSVESELSEPLQAKSDYEGQFRSSKPPPEDADVAAKGGRISSLEAELKEMRERYLAMSLQFAQVEAQREELVMTLKSIKKDKKWFS